MKNFAPTSDHDCVTRFTPRRPAGKQLRGVAMLLLAAALLSGCGPEKVVLDREKTLEEIKKLPCTATALDDNLTVTAGEKFSDENLTKLAELATGQDDKEKKFFNSVSLTLSGSKVTADGLAALKKMPNVTTLVLSDLPVTDDSLAHLSALVNLTDLDLAGTQITDAGLKHLEPLKALEYLAVPNTIGDEAIDGLKEKLPDLDVQK